MPVLLAAGERIERDPNVDSRYWLAREYFEETATDFYELALWCDANQLEEERDEHLNDALRLDANHAEARKRLGFTRRGRDWVAVEPSLQNTANASVASSGTAQDTVSSRQAERIAKLRKRQEILRKQQQVDQRIGGIAARLDSSNPAQVRQARLDLAEINDPLAIGPLTRAMQRTSVDTRVRLLGAIGRIPAPESTYALAVAAAIDLSPEVHGAAVELLRGRPTDRDRYVPVLEQALRSEKAGLVHNAAAALESLGEHQSVPQLIEALMTPTRTAHKTDEQPNWVPGLKLTDVWAGSNSMPIRAPS
jgi:HEAT repeat protein